WSRVTGVEWGGGRGAPGAAGMALVGLEISFLDGARPATVLAQAAPPPAPPPPPPAPEPEAAEPEPAPEPDRDGDGIADRADACPDEPETVNGVEDADGCPDVGEFVVENDRIVLEETVLFDVNRARVKHSGQRVLAAIAALSRQHPEGARMLAEGHADVRGTAGCDDWLSRHR